MEGVNILTREEQNVHKLNIAFKEEARKKLLALEQQTSAMTSPAAGTSAGGVVANRGGSGRGAISVAIPSNSSLESAATAATATLSFPWPATLGGNGGGTNGSVAGGSGSHMNSAYHLATPGNVWSSASNFPFVFKFLQNNVNLVTIFKKAIN